MSNPRSTELRPTPPEGQEPAAGASSGRRRSVITWVVVAILVAGAAVYGVRTVHFYEHHVETDDAYVEGDIDPVLPRISGYVTSVDVRDNQKVAAGARLVTVDTRDLEAKLAQAEAALSATQARVAAAQAQVTAARTEVVRTREDLARYAKLRARQEIPQQQYDAAHAAADAAQAAYRAALGQVGAARAEVEQRRADIQYLTLQISYGTIASPAAGVVSKKSVEVGQLVQAGQPLMAIVEDEDVWVVANFKETQLHKMRAGQSVEIEVDAYPGRVFHGRVDSFSAATGAKFSLLPPDNATGNFTKVVQRVPVKIVFTDPPDPSHPLRAGMSVTAIVNVG